MRASFDSRLSFWLRWLRHGLLGFVRWWRSVGHRHIVISFILYDYIIQCRLFLGQTEISGIYTLHVEVRHGREGRKLLNVL